MKFLIGLVVAIAVIIFIIIKLLSGGGGQAPQPKPQLESYAGTDTTMRMTIENPTQSPQTHREIQITVGNDDASLVVYKGYQQDVVRSKSYPMDTAAYRDFLRGLRLTGHYTDGNDNPDLRDEHGYCATGDRYVYEIIDGDGNAIQHYWSTSCGIKTFKGNINAVQELFQKQIPAYDDLTDDVDL